MITGRTLHRALRRAVVVLKAQADAAEEMKDDPKFKGSEMQVRKDRAAAVTIERLLKK